MSDKPILMSAPMVQALLDGRKTQTRRTIKPQPEMLPNGRYHVFNAHGGVSGVEQQDIGNYLIDYVRWQVGDRLWVREAHRVFSSDAHDCEVSFPADEHWFQTGPCTGQIKDADLVTYFKMVDRARAAKGYAIDRPSIHMPRWASRLTLVVTDVRVERLQDISKDDVIAEGITTHRDGYPITECFAGWHEPYADLWESINGAGSWAKNPWVAALTLSVHRCNIDALPCERIAEPSHA